MIPFTAMSVFSYGPARIVVLERVKDSLFSCAADESRRVHWEI